MKHDSHVNMFYKHIFDINVLVARQEALGCSLIEAAACGLCNIGTNVDGIPKIIQDNHSDFLFETENENMLAEKIMQLMADTLLRKKMGKNRHKLAIGKFSLVELLSQFSQFSKSK